MGLKSLLEGFHIYGNSTASPGRVSSRFKYAGEYQAAESRVVLSKGKVL